MESQYSVNEFYKDRSILVTGGSGFMGKVLVEKLLFTLEVRRVFLLLRGKRGRTVQQRLEDLIGSPIFDRIRNGRKEALAKIIPVEGDILLDNLGLSPEDMETLIADVSVVFHMAATVNMDTPIKRCVDMNVVGTQRALDVASRFKNLAVFVHVSTTFCYPDLDVLEEKFHSAPADPRKVMRLCEWLDDQQLALITPSLLGQHPNTYTYTKRLAESLVNDAYPDLPCVIARPSIVCPAYLEPLPGWVDNLNGPTGLLAGGGKGVIRSMLCDGSFHAQFIPVDLAINGLILIAMIQSLKKTRCESLPIYNLNIGHKNPITWNELLTIARDHGRKYPLSWLLWYPNAEFTTNYLVHETKRILFQLVPAYIIDFLLLIAGQKRFMVRVQEKISHGLHLLQYFTLREWAFPCPNYDAIHTKLSKKDDEMFITYKEHIDKQDYIAKGAEAARVYVLKEDPASIPFNRVYHKFLYVLDTAVKTLFWCFVLSLLAGWCEPVRKLLSFGEPVVKYMPFLGAAVLKGSNLTADQTLTTITEL